MAFNPNQPRDSHGRFGEVAAHAASAIAGVVSSTGNAAHVASAIARVLKGTVSEVPKKLDLSKFKVFPLETLTAIGNFQVALRAMSKAWLKLPLEPVEKDMVHHYTTSSVINKYMRGVPGYDLEDVKDEDVLGHHMAQQSILEDVISSSVVPFDLRLFRGMGPKSLKRFSKVGEEVTDYGFTSTSFSHKVAKGFLSYSDDGAKGAVAHIYVAKGKNALIPDGMSAHEFELEAILPPSKFKVLGHDPNGDVHLEML